MVPVLGNPENVYIIYLHQANHDNVLTGSNQDKLHILIALLLQIRNKVFHCWYVLSSEEN